MADPAELKRLFTDSDELCQYMHDTFGEPVILNFSLGKDSVTSWLQLRRFWKQVIPLYTVFIPGLKWVEKGLAYYEDFFGVKIHRYIRDPMWWHLEDCMWQPPDRVFDLQALPLPRTYQGTGTGQFEIEVDIRQQYGCPDAWTAHGLRALDSLTRRTAMKRAGPIRPLQRAFYPIYDWNFERMSSTIRDAGVKLMPDYKLFNRSFDSPRARFLYGIREHFPEDFERIKFWLPLIEAELKRREYALKAQGSFEVETEEDRNVEAEADWASGQDGDGGGEADVRTEEGGLGGEGG